MGQRAAIRSEEFIGLVRPLLESKDRDGLATLLKARWTCRQIAHLLGHDCPDVRKTAALALGLVGQRECLPGLIALLRDPDPMVNQMAEHALWNVWFRGGGCEANQHLARGTQALDRCDFACAVDHFNEAIAICPDFAEAYNQRAMVRYLQEDFDASLKDCLTAVRLMPEHFGAWAGMGHCHVHRGDVEEALSCYEKALSINPHLECVAEMVEELRNCPCGDDACGDDACGEDACGEDACRNETDDESSDD